jgi:methionine--tRNA ligase beta chain
MADYLYDGTFDGLLTCIHFHYYCEKAEGIYKKDTYQVNLMKSAIEVITDEEKAEAVSAAPVVAEEKIDFSKVEIEPLFADFVDFETFSKSDFRAVKVKACEAVKKSKKLLQFTLDDGTGTDRTILSGIHAYYEPEELVGKTLIAITNLPPRPMMGIESCGMLLSAIHSEEGEEKLHLLMVDNHIPAGAKLY